MQLAMTQYASYLTYEDDSAYIFKQVMIRVSIFFLSFIVMLLHLKPAVSA